MSDNSTWRQRRAATDVTQRFRAWSAHNDPRGEWHTSRNVFACSVDLSEIHRLMRGMRMFDLKQKDFVMTSALNRGADRMQTQIKNLLADRTGIKVKGRITEGFSKIRATPGNWQAGIQVEDRYTRVTKEYYGATWNKSMKGVAHHAWNQPQEAAHSFMIKGKKPAFIRVTGARYPLHVLFGPNMAREIDRNYEAVEHIATSIANWWVAPEMERLIELQWARMKQ